MIIASLIPLPYIVICGQSLADIKHAFVVAEPIKYQLTTPSDAINICFQLMKIFNQPYSSICNHVWELLEKQIYGFDVKSPFGNVTTLIEKLNETVVPEKDDKYYLKSNNKN